jgi:hypothetical protein
LDAGCLTMGLSLQARAQCFEGVPYPAKLTRGRPISTTRVFMCTMPTLAGSLSIRDASGASRGGPAMCVAQAMITTPAVRTWFGSGCFRTWHASRRVSSQSQCGRRGICSCSSSRVCLDTSVPGCHAPTQSQAGLAAAALHWSARRSRQRKKVCATDCQHGGRRVR